MPRLPARNFRQMMAILDDAVERDRFLVELVAPGLDARQIEDLVDQVQQVHAGIMDVAGIVPVRRHAVRPENFRLHHLGETQNGVERRAQLVAHLGEEARFGDIGGLGAAAGFVGDRFRLLELADQRVLFGARFQRGERGRIKPVGEQREIAFGGQRHGGEDVIVQRSLGGEIDGDGEGDRQREREHRDRQARRQHARYRHHEQHDEQHEGGSLLVQPDRIDQDEGPGHAEEQVEQDEAHPPRAQVRRARRLVEEQLALADDDEMNEECAAGPHAGRQRAGPQARQQPDGDDQKQDHRRRRDAVLGELAEQFVIEHRPRAAGRGQAIARLAHVLGRQPPLRLWRGGGGRKLVRFADRIGHCRPGLRGCGAGDELRQKWPKFLKTRLKVEKRRGEKSIRLRCDRWRHRRSRRGGWQCRAGRDSLAASTG